MDSYFAVAGKIVAHQRHIHCTRRDSSGEIWVVIDPAPWQGRKVGLDNEVRLGGESWARARPDDTSG